MEDVLSWVHATMQGSPSWDIEEDHCLIALSGSVLQTNCVHLDPLRLEWLAEKQILVAVCAPGALFPT